METLIITLGCLLLFGLSVGLLYLFVRIGHIYHSYFRMSVDSRKANEKQLLYALKELKDL